MATLESSLGELYTRSQKTQCKTALLLATLEPSDAQALIRAIDDVSVSPSSIAKWLGKHGYALSSDSIRRHRKRQRGGCLCSREES